MLQYHVFMCIKFCHMSTCRNWSLHGHIAVASAHQGIWQEGVVQIVSTAAGPNQVQTQSNCYTDQSEIYCSWLRAQQPFCY